MEMALTFQKAMDIAHSMKTAEKNMEAVHGTTSKLGEAAIQVANKVTVRKRESGKLGRTPCYSVAAPTNRKKNCRFKGSEGRGHIARMCHPKKKAEQAGRIFAKRSHKTQKVEEDTD